ncbi:MAG TPA: AMP-binding protein [Burkholderiales bacterium]|nr:AMP-binding protein [Burkholderiales bacterium]
MNTAYDLVWLAAERAPRQLALVDDRTDRALTYEELIAEIDTVAAGLAERGVKKGTRVATILPNLFEHCVVLLALQRLAAVPALLNFRLQPPELAKLVQQGEMFGAVVRDEPALEAALPKMNFVLTAANFSACRGDPAKLPPRPKPDPGDVAFIFYTSGTTGLPKGAVITHRTTEHRLAFLSTHGGLRAGGHNRALGMVPLSHAIGFYCVFLATLAYGGTYYVVSAFNPAAAVDMVEKHGITYLFSIPTLYGAMLAAPNYRPERMASLELVLFGGAPIAPALLERLGREWPAKLRHIYGTTEIMSPLHFSEPVGQPIRLRCNYGSRVRVVRPGAGPEERVAPGETGELIVDASAPTTFTEYLHRPDATAERLREGWYYTGDACVLREDGDLELVGRLDDVIRSGGENVYPEEVEAVLARHPAVRDACVIGIPDEKWGEMVVACVVLSGEGADVKSLESHFTSSPLARFKRPRAYLVLDALPRTPASKVMRKPLKEAALKAREGRDANFLEP